MSWLDEKDQPFEWLDKADEKRSTELVEIKIDPLWDDPRPDPRFRELLKKSASNNQPGILRRAVIQL